MKVRVLRDVQRYLLIRPIKVFEPSTDLPQPLVEEWFKLKKRLDFIEDEILEYINEHDPNYLDTKL